MAEPCCADEVEPLLRICMGLEESIYLRLVSVPWDIPFSLPEGYQPAPGQGCMLRKGTDAAIIAYGPITLSESFRAAEALEKEGLSVAVINLPWLNAVDGEWLEAALTSIPFVVSVDNHYTEGGQGDTLASALAQLPAPQQRQLLKLGVNGIPVSGAHDEVLRHHGLNAEGISLAVKALIGARAQPKLRARA